MAIQWPEGVPYKPLAGTITGEGFRPPLVTEFEDGPKRYRRSSTLNIATLQFSIRMDYPAFAIFKSWVRDDLVDGTLPFTMLVWVDGSYAVRTCRFAQPPRYADLQSHHADIAIVLGVEDF